VIRSEQEDLKSTIPEHPRVVFSKQHPTEIFSKQHPHRNILKVTSTLKISSNLCHSVMEEVVNLRGTHQELQQRYPPRREKNPKRKAIRS